VSKNLALAISAVLHPLLMPTLLYAVLFYFSPSVVSIIDSLLQWRLLMLIFITTFLIPLFSIWLLYRVGSITSLTIDNKNERFLPFLSTTLFYMLTTYLFMSQLRGYYTLIVILGSITASLALVTLISVFWKISAHSVGVCGVAGFLFGLYYKYADYQLFYPILVVVIIAGLVMSARLSLNAHDPVQVFAGGLLGWCISFGTIYWLV
jgi:membrane-associated phospholipid phosphatase